MSTERLLDLGESGLKLLINKRLAAGMTLWALSVCAGLSMMLSFENSPGAAGDAPASWPADSRIARAANQATLVMLAHPHCPCTSASLGELERLMARFRGRLEAHVLFYRPQGGPTDWTKSDLWDRAARIPHVRVSWDIGGLEAGRFRSATSGAALVFDAKGRLLFSGGVTGSRGHSGDNAGADAIAAALTTGVARARTFVFGCSLLDSRPAARGAIR